MTGPVLIYSRFPKSLMVRIGEKFDLIDASGKPPATVFPKEQLAQVRALITAGGQSLRADVMDSLPNLGAIVCYGTGYDGVDLDAAKARKIVVGNSPAANASAVADLAMVLMMNGMNLKIEVMVNGMRRRNIWTSTRMVFGMEKIKFMMLVLIL